MAYTQKQYTENDSLKKFREQMEAHAGLKPADYTSQYKPQIDSTVNSILNRKPFEYDVNGDALYQQYKDRYTNLGQQAMMDTMGQAAKLTGGYGNSNAQIVGQQAYQGYLQGLTDKIPELAQMAYNRYNQQGQDLYQQYGLLNAQDQAAYDRWNADYNRWLTERDYLSNRYDTERGYDYGIYRNTVGDDQWKAKFDEDIRRYDYKNKLGEFAVTPSSVGDSGGTRTGGNSTYKQMQAALGSGNYSAAEMLGGIAYQVDQGNLTEAQANALKADYYKPQVKKEVTASGSKNDTSAYWGTKKK